MPQSVAAIERAADLARQPLRTVSKRVRFFQGTWESYKDIWGYRELLGLLVRRELKARYKDSGLGILWSLVRPLAQLLIYYFVIGQVLGVARSIPSFAIFVFVGLTTWGLFTEIVSGSTTSIVANAGLVKKVYLPREIFPLASTGGAMFNFSVQFAIMLAATIVFQEPPIHSSLVYAIPSLLLIVIFAVALGILLAAVNVYLRDVQHLIEVIMVVLFWASPIVYSFGFVHAQLSGTFFEQLYLANPVTLGILGMQKAFWVAGSSSSDMVNWPPDLAVRLGIALIISIALLWLSQRIFARLQGNFAQEL